MCFWNQPTKVKKLLHQGQQVGISTGFGKRQGCPTHMELVKTKGENNKSRTIFANIHFNTGNKATNKATEKNYAAVGNYKYCCIYTLNKRQREQQDGEQRNRGQQGSSHLHEQKEESAREQLPI